MEKEPNSERAEYLSDLYRLRNHLLGQLGEVDMAIMRESNSFEAKRAKTVTQQTQELLHRIQQPRPIWATEQYQKQALTQDDAKSMQTEPPYDLLLQ